MKHFHSHLGLALMPIAIGFALLTSCQADVDLENVDKTIEMEMNVAAPVGQVSVTISDFLQNINKSIEQNGMSIAPDERRTLTFYYSYEIDRPFGTLTTEELIGTMRTTSPISTSLDLTTVLPAGTTIYGPYEGDLPVNINIPFGGLNGPTFLSDFGRVDSIIIADANFSINLSKSSSLNIKESQIKQIEIKSDDIHFTDPTNAIFTVSQFGNKINNRIRRDFSINFMKDRNFLTLNNIEEEDCNQNVRSSVPAQVVVSLSLAAGESLTIPSDARINVDFEFGVNAYKAMWGFFKASNKLRSDSTINFNEVPGMEFWKDMKSLKLPLAEPEISMTATTQVAGPLTLDLDHLYVQTADENGNPIGDPHYATFGGGKSHTYQWDFIEYNQLGSTQNDNNSFETQVYNQEFKNTYVLTADDSHGNLDELLNIRPDIMSYAFQVRVRKPVKNDGLMPSYERRQKLYLQQRMTDYDKVKLNMDVKLPFVFGKGLELAYPDTIDVNWSGFNLDSLVNSMNMNLDNTEIKASDLCLYIDVRNTFPLDIDFEYDLCKEDFSKILGFDSILQVIDENGNPKPYTPYLLNIKANEAFNQGEPVPGQYGTTRFIIRVNKDRINSLSEVRHILFKATVKGADDAISTHNIDVIQADGTTISQTISSNTISLKSDAKLTIKLSASAELAAVLSFDKENTTNNNAGEE